MGAGCMARLSKKNSRWILAAIFTILVAYLVAVAFTALRQHYFLTATKLSGWATVPLSLLLMFIWPTRCRVKTARGKPCRRVAYGFLFGCHDHRLLKLSTRLGFHKAEAARARRGRPSNSYVLMYQPAPGAQPLRVSIEDSRMSICGFWVTAVASTATLIQLVVTFAAGLSDSLSSPTHERHELGRPA